MESATRHRQGGATRRSRPTAGRFLIFWIIGVIALVAAGCGDDSDSADDSGSGSGTEATQDPIVIEGVANMSYYPGVDDGALARLEAENRAGGIDGRMFEFKGVQDDNHDEQRNTTIVRSIVQKDKAFAVLPIASDTFPAASSDFLASQKTPYVGWGITSGFCDSEWGYGWSGCLINQDTVNSSLVDPVIAATGKDAKDLKVAIQSGDNPGGHAGNELYKALFSKRGADVVYVQADLPPNDPPTSYAPWVQALLASDPDIIYISNNFPNEVGLSGALSAAGYDGMIVGFTTYQPGLLEDQPNVADSIDGIYINVQIPPQEEESPAIKQMQEDLEAVDKSPVPTLGTSLGYWQADVFIQMLKATKGDLTGENVKKTVNGGFEYKSEKQGGAGDLSFPENLSVAAPCAALVQVVDAEYVVKEPFSCYENIKIK